MRELRFRRSIAVSGAIAASLASAGVHRHALAQQTLDNPVGEIRPHKLDSGIVANGSNEFRTVFTDVIHIDGAAWIRLYFGEVNLPDGGFVRVTSGLDGEVQTLDSSTMSMWGETSAYFNGDTVFLDLVAAPGSAGNRVTVAEIGLQTPPHGSDGECGICGVDERYPTNVAYAGRLVPVGCTATIWTDNGCLVSAGHCMGNNQVIEFNVPPSDPDCTLNHPPIEDQFPITDYDYSNNGVGDDWAAMTAGTNNLGENAYQHQGELRPIATSLSNVNDPVDVWGYAIDDNCEKTQVQQHSPSGEITSRQSTWYELNSDITFGNSGSSIINASGEIIGIVTHCSFGCPNYGTRIDRSDFTSAREEMCPGGPGELVLANPAPGLAGRTNDVIVSNATPGEAVWVVYGLRSGLTAVPDCPGVNVGIAAPVIVGNDIADANGDAVVSGFVPNAARGLEIHLQGIELTNCRVSEVVRFTFL